MRIKRNCKVCGTEFIAIKSTQLFESRKCFKKDYYLRKKAELAVENASPKYPSYYCNICNFKIDLTFDPVKNSDLFENHKCPNCNFTRKHAWQHNVEFIFTFSEVSMDDGLSQQINTTITIATNPITPF